MNVENGTEAAQILFWEWEYRMGFSGSVVLSLQSTIMASHHHAIVAKFQILNHFYNIQQQKYTVIRLAIFPSPHPGFH
jgi:hypothetical protein